MKTWGPVVLALLSFGTAVMEHKRAEDTKAIDLVVIQTMASAIDAMRERCTLD